MIGRKLRLDVLEAREMLTTLFVTSDSDSGEGSLRAAIEAANADAEVNRIVVAAEISAIEIDSPVEYTNSQAIRIIGNTATLSASEGNEGAFDIFTSSGGADLAIQNMEFANGSKGVHVPIAADQTGTVNVILKEVAITDNGLFGLHIDDQSSESDASINLKIFRSTVTGNGTGELDFDGVRVDEGGVGGITARVVGTAIDANGGDGLELDERGEGGVRMTTLHSSYDDNGFFNEADLDDGLDIDEADDGGLWFRAVNSTFSGNFDQGLDLDEEQGGNVYVNLNRVEANENLGEGIKVDEKFDDDAIGSAGNLVARFHRVTANGNVEEEGIALTEEGAGNFFANFTHVTANANGKEGIDFSEDGDGHVRALFLRVMTESNLNDGIQIEEAGGGRLAVTMIRSKSNLNTGFGIKVEQEDVDPNDRGRLFLLRPELVDNVEGEIEAIGTTIV